MNGKKGNLLDSNSLKQLFKDDTLYQLGAPEAGQEPEENAEPEPPLAEAFIEQVEKQDVKPNWHLEGDPESDLMLVFFHGSASTIPEDGKATVQGLIENPKAMNRQLDGVASINWEQHAGVEWEQLLKEVRAKKILCWGGFPGDIELEPNKYEIQQLNGVEYLLADDPAVLAGNTGLKGKLWMAIKNNWL